MELTVLGKYGPYGKAATGAASGYLVKNQDDYLVMDMGSGTLSRLIGAVDITKIRHIFVSHLHFDHTSDLLPLQYLLEEKNHTVNIYTHKEETPWYKILFGHPNFNIINIDENSRLRIGGMALSFVPMKHTATDYAVIINGEKTLCYTGDTVFNGNLPKCFETSDCVLADCSKPRNFKGPHMNVSDAISLSQKYPARIIATHLSADFDPTREFEKYKNITVAEELETYIL